MAGNGCRCRLPRSSCSWTPGPRSAACRHPAECKANGRHAALLSLHYSTGVQCCLSCMFTSPCTAQEHRADLARDAPLLPRSLEPSDCCGTAHLTSQASNDLADRRCKSVLADTGPLLQAGQSEALRWACQAVAWLAQGMQLQGGFRRHPARYNHLVHRYEQRFAFLQRHGSPGSIPYEHLMHDMDQCEAFGPATGPCISVV